MKKITLLSLSLIFAISFSSFSQENKLEESYQQYFKLPREAFFIHSNKTTYLTGEEIWFNAYVFDRKNALPSKKTSNIYVGIYDSIGKQVDKKLFLGKKGFAKGNIKIDSTLPSGSYYLKASTNWSKNFKENETFSQKIEIINSKIKRSKSINKVKFDLQFLPEGGHMVENIKNVIGFKYLNDEGKGDYISGTIYDKDNNIVSNFKSNALGMGKFTFIPKSNQTYTAKFTLDNDIEESVQLPFAKSSGIAISVDNTRKGNAFIKVNANQKYYNQLSTKDFKILIHRDGWLKVISFQLDKASKIIPLSKKELFSGVNTITLVNSNDIPLAERLIFNNDFKKHPLALTKTNSDFDSISYSLRSIYALDSNEEVNLSISVLPKQTKSYNPNHNIISALLIQPYIKGSIENASYYFKDFGLKNQYELDILLLTQGWSKYSWDDIKKGQPKPIYDFEDGISVNGNVNSSLKKVKSFIVYPTKHHNSMFIDASNKFNFNNYYLEKGEQISFSAIMRNGKMKRPLINLSPIIKVGNDFINQDKLTNTLLSYYSDKNEIPNNFITKGYEELDEVNIVVKKKERLRDPQFPNAQITQVTKNIANQYPSILDFIRNRGFDVSNGNEGIFLGKVQITSRGRGQGAAPALFVDGIQMTDFNILLTITTDKVDQILIDRSGIGLGLSGGNAFGGVIKITTRNTSITSPNLTSPDIFSTKITYGFEPVKEFYAPKYPSYRIKPFRDYGVIHWDSNVTLKNVKDYTFKTINTSLDEVTFFIEGISSTGKMFSQIINLKQ